MQVGLKTMPMNVKEEQLTKKTNQAQVKQLANELKEEEKAYSID